MECGACGREKLNQIKAQNLHTHALYFYWILDGRQKNSFHFFFPVRRSNSWKCAFFYLENCISMMFEYILRCIYAQISLLHLRSVGNANRISNQKTKDLNYKNENHIFIECALQMQKKKTEPKMHKNSGKTNLDHSIDFPAFFLNM